MWRAARRLIVVTSCAAVSSGCLVGSLHPVYDEGSIVLDAALVGKWENRELEVSVDLSRGEWRSYRIAFTDRFGTTVFTGHLTALGKARLLNVLPEGALESPPFVLATNGFMQIEVESDRLRVREPDYDVVRKRAAAATLGTPAATDAKQNVILTAPSARLRKWLVRAVNDPSLWAEWKTFTRSVR